MSSPPSAAYYSLEFQRLTGGTLRPGGLVLTDKAIGLGRFLSGTRVLDLGCGLGVTVGHLRAIHAIRAVGIDLSAKMLTTAIHRQPQISGCLAQARGNSLPIRSSILDGIICECVLSLMTRPSRVLGECHRILRPGGCLVISDLYARGPTADDPAMAPGDSCLAGIRNRTDIHRMVGDAGFNIKQWEDHSRQLTQLAADMIFAQGSLDRFYHLINAGSRAREAACRSKPGYYLMIATKKEDHHG